jgi:anti-sigma B factor antagonist
MNVTMNRNDTQLTVNIQGRLDTLTAPELEEKLEDAFDGVEELIIDLDGLEYISSAGLRVILSVIKQMDEQGEMKLRNVCSDVMEVFEVTGFTDLLNIE